MTSKTCQLSPSGRNCVELSERDVRDATRLLTVLAGVGVLPSASDEQPAREQLVARARREIANRKKRMQQFPKGMFGEPAWDILLVLYVTDGFAPETIRDLRELSGLTHTTALRWLDYLESHQLIARKSHPSDKRSAYIQLTPQATDKLDQYFADMTVGQ